jgi:FtsH-binding integral membrane protein
MPARRQAMASYIGAAYQIDQREKGGLNMTTGSLPSRPHHGNEGSAKEIVDIGLRHYMLRVYSYMATGLALTGAVAAFAIYSGLYQAIYTTPLFWVVLLAPLGLVLLLGFRVQKMSLRAVQVTFWFYAALIGLSLAGIFLVYTGASIARVFFITSATFAAMSLYGYTTGADLTRFGSFLFMGLIGIIVAGVVKMFVASSALQFAISVIGVLIFVGLTAYDTQRIKDMYSASDDDVITGKSAVVGALQLYLDFINLFVLLLRLFGSRRR